MPTFDRSQSSFLRLLGLLLGGVLLAIGLFYPALWLSFIVTIVETLLGLLFDGFFASSNKLSLVAFLASVSPLSLALHTAVAGFAAGLWGAFLPVRVGELSRGMALALALLFGLLVATLYFSIPALLPAHLSRSLASLSQFIGFLAAAVSGPALCRSQETPCN